MFLQKSYFMKHFPVALKVLIFLFCFSDCDALPFRVQPAIARKAFPEHELKWALKQMPPMKPTLGVVRDHLKPYLLAKYPNLDFTIATRRLRDMCLKQYTKNSIENSED